MVIFAEVSKNEFDRATPPLLRLGRYGSFRWQVNAVCAGKNCEIPREGVPYLSDFEVCSRQGVIQIHVYLACQKR